MRVSEIIRNILDLIDQADTEEVVNDIDPNPEGYEDNDIKRFRQIVDVADTDEVEGYANTPNEKVANLDAVTHDAGADSWQGTKEPEDIRGTTTRIYGDN